MGRCEIGIGRATTCPISVVSFSDSDGLLIPSNVHINRYSFCIVTVSHFDASGSALSTRSHRNVLFRRGKVTLHCTLEALVLNVLTPRCRLGILQLDQGRRRLLARFLRQNISKRESSLRLLNISPKLKWPIFASSVRANYHS